MNFVAHGNNKISKLLLLEFFARALLRHRESLVLMVSKALFVHDIALLSALYMSDCTIAGEKADGAPCQQAWGDAGG